MNFIHTIVYEIIVYQIYIYIYILLCMLKDPFIYNKKYNTISINTNICHNLNTLINQFIYNTHYGIYINILSRVDIMNIKR